MEPRADKWTRPDRLWVVAWPNARSAHFVEAARDRAAEPMPNGSAPVVTEYVPRAEYDALVAKVADWEGDKTRALLVEANRALTARADKAEALLREARVWVHDGVMGRFTPRSCAETVLARIEALLDGKAAP